MKNLILIIFSIICTGAAAQNAVLRTGDVLPDIIFKPLLNAPVKEFSIPQAGKTPFYIINFWGTWCSPCIPEMAALAKLQDANPTIRIIAVADDSPGRLSKYLAKKNTKVWLVSDTAFFLYKALGFTSVGQSAIVNNKHQIIALVKTDSINQHMINDLLKGKKISSNAEIKELAAASGNDLFGVDSTQTESFTIRGYMKGQQSMGRRYLNATYAGRRLSFINTCLTTLYKDAYGIVSSKQILYEINEKDACDFDKKQSLYCLDLLVKPEQADSILTILQKRLQNMLPVKARLEERSMPVYVLKQAATGSSRLAASHADKSSYSFSGRGYTGTGVTLAEFANDYLSNEMGLPVVDESGLTGRFNIETNVDERTLPGVTKSIAHLGFLLQKAERKLKVLILYK